MTDAPIEQVVETLFSLSARLSIRQNKTLRQHLRQAGSLLAFPEEGLEDHPLVKALLEEQYEAQAEQQACAESYRKTCEQQRARIAALEQQLAASRREHINDLIAATRRAGTGGCTTNSEPLAVLGLQQGATASDIRKRHRELMQIHHPDRGGRTEVMGRINAARDAALKTT